jgi:hypothetical protein
VVLANPTFRFEGPFGLHFHCAGEPLPQQLSFVQPADAVPASAPRGQIVPPPVLRPSPHQPLTLPTSLSDRYRQALEAQERLMRSWQTP